MHQSPEAFRTQAMDIGLSEQDLDEDPVRQFQRWYEEAIGTGIPEPNAMSLATVDPDGQPSLRSVLLKLYDARGFVFFTNYESRKATEMAGNPRVACLFPWVGLARQVCILGQVERISTAESLRYFTTRPRGSQIGAWASHQSRPLESREALMQRVSDLELQYEGAEVPRPPYWTGFVLSPETVEFWTQREFRLHDRFLYSQQNGEWSKQRLNP